MLSPDAPSAVPRHARILGFKSWRSFAGHARAVSISRPDERVVRIIPTWGSDFLLRPDQAVDLADPSPQTIAETALRMLSVRFDPTRSEPTVT